MNIRFNGVIDDYSVAKVVNLLRSTEPNEDLHIMLTTPGGWTSPAIYLREQLSFTRGRKSLTIYLVDEVSSCGTVLTTLPCNYIIHSELLMLVHPMTIGQDWNDLTVVKRYEAHRGVDELKRLSIPYEYDPLIDRRLTVEEISDHIPQNQISSLAGCYDQFLSNEGPIHHIGSSYNV